MQDSRYRCCELQARLSDFRISDTNFFLTLRHTVLIHVIFFLSSVGIFVALYRRSLTSRRVIMFRGWH